MVKRRYKVFGTYKGKIHTRTAPNLREAKLIAIIGKHKGLKKIGLERTVRKKKRRVRKRSFLDF